MPDYNGVMIYGETLDGKLSAISAELLGCGRSLADNLGQELSMVIIGSGIAGLAEEAIAFGADKVLVVDDPLLVDYQTDTYVAVMEKTVKEVMPKVILMGQTSIGRDLAPRLAFRLGTIATLDCIGLDIDLDTKRLTPTKPVYGGSALAVFAYETDPQVATVRAKVMSPMAKDTTRKGEVISITADLNTSDIRAKLLRKVKEEVTGIKLEEAPIVISGGRGIGGANEFKELEELAELLKGAVGGSRPVCDNGWLADTQQVGLTGKIVSPDLYLAVAISGSSQHLAGCSGAKVIVAINKDPEANIFKAAHYGLVGDWKKVLPAFTQKVKELMA